MANIAFAQQVLRTDVLVIGGGTGGTAAGIQSARLGAKTIIAEPGTWLGGMLSAAGVSATDGNHNLPSGIWNEFRNAIYKVYGGPKKVATGWISNTQFEPHVADSIFKAMAAKEKNLSVHLQYTFSNVIKKGNQIIGADFIDIKTNKKVVIYAKQTIEATELGDVIASANIAFSVGMESSTETGENVGVKETNGIIQDLTYVAILKDFGKDYDKTIARPSNYSAEEFDGACTDYYKNIMRKAPTVDAKKMLDYAKLPHEKYMINWPSYGNDLYLNVIFLTPMQREIELEKAKQQTLRFVYFIQTQLGYKNLGLATDEFGTKDGLALMPYYRESRRVKGMVRFTVDQISNPFDYGVYRTGIAVGDYPIDHHHKKNMDAPQHLSFYPIPSFNVPLGSLVPEKTDGLIVAEKSISVSNVVNGTTRLQPCVLLIGQAAGTLAALAVKNRLQARKVQVREVQQELLNSNVLIMPYRDAGIEHPNFKSMQKIGATGILKGKGIPYQWANQTWFYPDSTVDAALFKADFSPFGKAVIGGDKLLTVANAITTVFGNGTLHLHGFPSSDKTLFTKAVAEKWSSWNLHDFNIDRPITRAELAVLLDRTIDPFNLKPVDHKGDFIK